MDPGVRPSGVYSVEGTLKEVVNLGNGMTPSLAPTIKSAMMWLLYSSGVPPYDLFAGRPVMPRPISDKGGWPALKRMVEWQVNEMGLSQFATYDPAKKSTAELAVSITPILNRILKFSDYGMEEKKRNAKNMGGGAWQP